MFNSSSEQVWQFNLQDGAHCNDNGLAQFESRARELAATIGCNLTGMKDVRLELIRGGWKVTGTAILGKLKAAG